MFPYWLMLLIPSPYLLFRRGGLSGSPRVGVYLFAALLALFIGFRDRVGCDWYNYEAMHYAITSMNWDEAIRYVDPLYALLNWVSGRLGFGVYGANVVCGAIFSYGLARFAIREPQPYLFIIAAFPMLIVTVAMGYTRQATAIGVLMLALNAFADRQLFRYLLLVGLAVLFHSTAIIFAPAAIFLSRRNMAVPLVITIFGVAAVSLAFVSERLEAFLNLYIDSNVFEGEGGGAIYRVSINGIAVALFALFYKRWRKQYPDTFLFIIFLGLSTLSFFAMLISPVAADRMALYFLPLQAAVFARLPILVAGPRWGWMPSIGVAACMAAVMAVWFQYANHSACWVPYRSILIPAI